MADAVGTAFVLVAVVGSGVSSRLACDVVGEPWHSVLASSWGDAGYK